MTPNQFQILQELRHEGYAIIVWSPEELRGADPHLVENSSIERGWDIIDCLATEPENEDNV